MSILTRMGARSVEATANIHAIVIGGFDMRMSGVRLAALFGIFASLWLGMAWADDPGSGDMEKSPSPAKLQNPDARAPRDILFRGCAAATSAAVKMCREENDDESRDCDDAGSAVFSACFGVEPKLASELALAMTKSQGAPRVAADGSPKRRGYDDDCEYFCEDSPPPRRDPDLRDETGGPQLGGYCYTWAGVCDMGGQRGPIGMACYCPSYYGPIGGQVGR